MINRIAVIGAGTMGHGIAHVFARFGYPVNLYESFDQVREHVMEKIQAELLFMANEDYISFEEVEKTMANITLFSELEPAVKDADFVIEAIPEKLALKQELFAQLDRFCPSHTVFASNTSSLKLDDMMQNLPKERQARTMICHWYNPPHLIPIAELSCFGNMEPDLFQQVYDLHVRVEKQPVRVKKDISGLVANRLLHAMAREAFHLAEIGAASAEDIDIALKYGPGFRSATTGLLETADMGGLDVWCAAEDNFFVDLDASPRACEYLRQKVEAGQLGIKSGEGFFHYPPEEQEAVREAFYKRLLTQLKASKEY